MLQHLVGECFITSTFMYGMVNRREDMNVDSRCQIRHLHHDFASGRLLDRLLVCVRRATLRAVDSASKAHAKVDADAILDGAIHDCLVVREVKIGEEAE